MTRLGFVGGTGPQGMGLAYRFALVGHEVIIGSRQRERAEAAAAEIAARGKRMNVRGATNEEAAREAELAFLSIPYEGQAAALPPLADACAGKTVIVTDVPVAFENGKAVMLDVPEGSATEQAQALLPGARVVAAFQNLAAKKLWDDAELYDQDVLVCADDDQAKRDALGLAEQIGGLRGVDAGSLRSARVVEAITVLLIGINQRYKTLTGVQIVGL